MPSRGQTERNLRRLHHHVDPKHPRGQHDVHGKGKGKGTDASSMDKDGLESQEAHDERVAQEQQEQQMQQQMQQMQPNPYGGFDGGDMNPMFDFFDMQPEAPLDIDEDFGDLVQPDHENAASVSGFEVYTDSGMQQPLGKFPISQDEQTAYIKRAYQRGRGGFHLPPGQVPGNPDPILNIELPEWMARTWSICLQRMRFEGGVVGLGTVPATVVQEAGGIELPNLDHQIDTSGGIKVRIEWGVGGCSDRAFVDYPFGGGILTVNAASLRVYVMLPSPFVGTGAPLPSLGGYLVPFPPAAMSDPFRGWNVYTSKAATIPATTGTAQWPVPPRATAYQLYAVTAFTVSQNVKMSQMRNAVSLSVIQQDDQQILSPDVGGQPPQDFWTRLHPQAQLVQLANTTAAPITLGVRFLIDLG